MYALFVGRHGSANCGFPLPPLSVSRVLLLRCPRLHSEPEAVWRPAGCVRGVVAVVLLLSCYLPRRDTMYRQLGLGAPVVCSPLTTVLARGRQEPTHPEEAR